ncbi:zinc finger CCCH-type with G patch domain-containing protein [Condylostylus longicornis]|uniref:zinc finger CCCH-type with G patch domain-containing protein n=1 Tax=Condylostylus longicornis TaxID=2530218 RepID=UPI00244E4112|nr:zinc finger CCCH-type with G patch domain-containing protein [Condylostylus longicornis]
MCDPSEIQQYLEQLIQVEEALKYCEDAERASLESLKTDLNELLELTAREQCLKPQEEDTLIGSTGNGECNDQLVLESEIKQNTEGEFDDEMALFMSEIKQIENTSEIVKNCTDEKEANLKLEDVKKELLSMIGKKCSAPHLHSWGVKAYHNALICGIDDTKEYELDDIKNFCVRIMFTNPTHQEMVPCSYFLNGECRFDVDKCRFSHGELVPFGDLQEYHEPDFSKLEKNCVVLAKMDDKLWHKGKVLNANFEQNMCRILIDRGKCEMDFHFEDLLPMVFDNESYSSDLSSDSDSNSSHFEDDINKAREAKLIEQSLLSPNASQKLGEWEKYTKGIGSKLLQKMGYIVGTGLGASGEGIVVPVSAQILPPGRSLDHCMELRELANGDENLFSVERKMMKDQQKAELKSAKQYGKEINRSDMFSFLNENILTGSLQNEDSNKKNIQKPNSSDYKNHSNKNLNVESVRIADDIRKKEKEIEKLQQSLKRHVSGSDMHNKLLKIRSAKDLELENLKKSEHYLSKEQNARKNKNKLDIF